MLATRTFQMIALGMSMTLPFAAVAQQTVAERETLVTETEAGRLAEEAARWRLTDEEYNRYLDHLEGPRARLSDPTITPIEVLGIEATSPTERERYARLWVEMIRRDTAKVLAFTRSVDDAWREISPDRKIIDPMLLASLRLKQGQAGGAPLKSALPARLLIFMPLDCPSCNGAIERYVAGLERGQHTGLDLFFLDAQGQSANVQNWARSQGLPVTLVQDGTITLNIDQGEFDSLKASLGFTASMPVILERRGQDYDVVQSR